MKSVRRSMAVSVVCRVVTLAVLLATPPIFLHFGSKQLLGGWLVLIAVPAVLNLFDLGVPHMAGTYMAISYAEGDYEGYRALFWTAIAYSLGACPLIEVLAFTLRGAITQVSVHDVDPAALALAVGLVVSLSQFTATVQNAVRARGEINFSQFADASRSGVELAVVTIVLSRGATLLGCIFALLLVRALFLGGVFCWLTIFDPTHRISSPKLRLGAWRQLLMPSVTYALSGAGQLGYVQAPLLVISAAAGAGASAAYAATRTLSRMGPQIILPLLDPLRTTLSASHARGGEAEQRVIVVRSIQVVLWSGLVAALGLALVGRPVFLRWTLGKLPFDPVLFWILLASSVFYGFSQVLLLYLAAIGRHQVLSSASFVMVAAAIGLSAAFGAHTRAIAVLLLCADVGACLVGIMVTRSVMPRLASAIVARGFAPPWWLVSELRMVHRGGLARVWSDASPGVEKE